MIINIGCLHSGTRYMAHLFQAWGLDVRHEEIGNDGISSCELASPRITRPASTSAEAWGLWEDDGYGPPLVVYTVRNPHEQVLSILKNTDSRWAAYRKLFAQEMGDLDGATRLEQALRLMAHWHHLCFKVRSPDVVIPLEDAPGRVAALVVSEHLRPANRSPTLDELPPTNDHTKGPSLVTRDELKAMFEGADRALVDSYHELMAFYIAVLRGCA